MFSGFKYLTLVSTITIFQIGPLVIVVFSVIFLKETVGYRRWISVIVGFSGALLILKPGTDMFAVFGFFPILAAIFSLIGSHLILAGLFSFNATVFFGHQFEPNLLDFHYLVIFYVLMMLTMIFSIRYALKQELFSNE